MPPLPARAKKHTQWKQNSESRYCINIMGGGGKTNVSKLLVGKYNNIMPISLQFSCYGRFLHMFKGKIPSWQVNSEGNHCRNMSGYLAKYEK